jgi:hypothetical protein
MAKQHVPTSTDIKELQKQAIADAVRKALHAKCIDLNMEMSNGTHKEPIFLMDDEAWTESAAIAHILGKYSWYKA